MICSVPLFLLIKHMSSWRLYLNGSSLQISLSSPSLPLYFSPFMSPHWINKLQWYGLVISMCIYVKTLSTMLYPGHAVYMHTQKKRNRLIRGIKMRKTPPSTSSGLYCCYTNYIVRFEFFLRIHCIGLEACLQLSSYNLLTAWSTLRLSGCFFCIFC